MTPEQHALEAEAGKIIWAAASLTPGTPGHAGKTTKLIAAMVQLLREAGRVADESSVQLVQEELPESPTGRTPEPPKLQQLPPPGVDAAELDRLRAVYAKPEWRH